VLYQSGTLQVTPQVAPQVVELLRVCKQQSGRVELPAQVTCKEYLQIRQEDSVVRKFRTTAADGKSYKVTYYNLDVIISIGYRAQSHRGT